MAQITKYYKSEQSYLNQQGYFRIAYNQVRPNKETTRFTKVKTSAYTSLLQEMQDKNQYEYICAGLNSFEREVVVIDSDDTSFGKNALSKLQADGLIPHCQKVKSNGHSQTFFFIEPFHIGSAGFSNKKYWEKDDLINHEQWKRLTKMINYLYFGDICYTGFNCQNPLYVNANTTSYRNINKLYTVKELYEHCLKRFSDIENLDYYLKILRSQAILLKPKHQKKIDEQIQIVIKYKESISNQSNHSIITNDTLDNIAEKVLDETDNIITKAINERIFIVSSQVAKSFKVHNALSFENLDEISRTAYKNFVAQDEAVDYTCQELINRIRYDIKNIILKDKYNQMDWNKVGYTNEQRKLSLKIRQDKHKDKLNIILSIITNDTLSLRKVAERYKEITGNKIGVMTVKRIIDEINNNNNNNNNNIKESNQIKSNHSIITNDTLLFDFDKKYIKSLAEQALELNNIGEEPWK